MKEEWKDVYDKKTADAKASAFQELITKEFIRCFPEKSLKVSSDDQHWITQKIKKLDRQRKRCYHKSRRSDKWKKLNKVFKKELKLQKANFYKKNILRSKGKESKSVVLSTQENHSSRAGRNKNRRNRPFK